MVPSPTRVLRVPMARNSASIFAPCQRGRRLGTNCCRRAADLASCYLIQINAHAAKRMEYQFTCGTTRSGIMRRSRRSPDTAPPSPVTDQAMRGASFDCRPPRSPPACAIILSGLPLGSKVIRTSTMPSSLRLQAANIAQQQPPFSWKERFRSMQLFLLLLTDPHRL